MVFTTLQTNKDVKWHASVFLIFDSGYSIEKGEIKGTWKGVENLETKLDFITKPLQSNEKCESATDAYRNASKKDPALQKAKKSKEEEEKFRIVGKY